MARGFAWLRWVFAQPRWKARLCEFVSLGEGKHAWCKFGWGAAERDDWQCRRGLALAVVILVPIITTTTIIIINIIFNPSSSSSLPSVISCCAFGLSLVLARFAQRGPAWTKIENMPHAAPMPVAHPICKRTASTKNIEKTSLQKFYQRRPRAA